MSRAAAEPNEHLEAWRTLPLGRYRYVSLYARYEKVHQGGQVLDVAVLIANGVDSEGHRHVLSGSVPLLEAEVHWRVFLSGLKERGLHDLELVVSDAHDELAAAHKAVFPGEPWQRCQFHLQQNAGQYVPAVAMRSPVATDIRAIFNAPDRAKADHVPQKFLDRYVKTAPQLVQWPRIIYCSPPAAAYHQPAGADE